MLFQFADEIVFLHCIVRGVNLLKRIQQGCKMVPSLKKKNE